MHSTPWVNYSLIAVNVVIFVLTYGQIQQLNDVLKDIATMQHKGMFPGDLYAQITQFPVYHYYLHAQGTELKQFVTYMFLHNGWLHLIGNMIFLYAFGNNVEDRLGKLGYLGFYLAGGVVAGLGNQLFSDAPVLGASGAVTAVTGAYLALFPKTNITLVYWWFIIGSFEVAARDLIIFFVVLDTIFSVTGVSNVAYSAHISGYIFGFSVMMLLLLVHLLPRERYDMIAAIEQYRRRQEFKRLTKQGYSPWESYTPPKAGDPPRRADADNSELTPAQQQLMELRTRIASAIAAHDMPAAAGLYLELLKLDSEQILSQQHQLDIANQLMAEGATADAARAYELLLRHYRGYSERAHVHLILALIYARYLHQTDRARELLADDVMNRLSESDAALAGELRAEVGA